MILHNYLQRQNVRTQATRRRHLRARRLRALAQHLGTALAFLGVAALYGACIVGFWNF